MKVLHLTSGNMYGGVEAVLATLARCRGASAGMEPHFGLCFEGRLSRELREAGTAVHNVGASSIRRPWTIAASRQRLGRLLDDVDFEAVICHQSWVMALFGNTAVTRGIPLFFWAHGGLTGKHWLDRWASRTTPDAAIANSYFTAGTVPSLYRTAPISVIHCPANLTSSDDVSRLPARATMRESLATSAADTVIVQVSRMEEWKGHRLHLEALGKLKDVPGWSCWMVGGAQRPKEQKYADSLKRLANELGIGERVRFLGSRPDVGALLASADIFCQPNTSPEPFGMVFIEALLSGLPVVTTNFGGGAEIVDPSCGLLTEPGSAQAVASALRLLLDNATLRMELGGCGPARARAISDPAKQLPKLLRLIAAYATERPRKERKSANA